MSNITWMMDVDGVLNNFMSNPKRDQFTRKFRAGNGYEICWQEDIMNRIRKLHMDGTVTVKWLTTWCEEANLHLRDEFGFGDIDLEVIGDDSFNQRWDLSEWWKLTALMDYATLYPDEKIIWTDDELCVQEQALTYAENNGILAVSPSPCLSHADLDLIESWITNAQTTC